MDIDIHVCYVDFKKAFDKVRREKLVQILQAKHIDKGDLRTITNLYWNQCAQIIVDNKKSSEMNIKRGVRQGCVMCSSMYTVNKFLKRHYCLKIKE